MADDREREDADKARTLITGALLGELSRRLLEYENAITWNTSCLSCPAVLDSSIRETFRREQAEGKLAEIRRVMAGFFAHYGNSTAVSLEKARDLAEGIRQVLDRDKNSSEEAEDRG